MVLVIQSQHEEFGVFPSALCALIQVRFGYLDPATAYGMIFCLPRILLLGCVFLLALLKVFSGKVVLTLVSNPGTWKWHCLSPLC